MRILQVISSLDPEAGGTVVVASRLAAAQAQLGHEVRLLCYATAGRRSQTEAALADIPNFSALTVESLPPAGRTENLFAFEAKQRLRQLIQPGCMLHLHGVWPPLLKSAARIANQSGVPYVVTPHGMLDPWSLQQKRWKKRIALLLGYQNMLNRATFLHMLNNQEAELIMRLGLRCPVKVIPNGVFLEEIDPLPEHGRFYAKHPQLEGRPFILFLSRLHYKKGLDLLATAFNIVGQHMPDVHLVVAGPDGGAQEDFESRISTAGLTSRVHVVGPIYGSEKYEAFVDASCFCLPSRQEGFSMAITEALACGVTTVITEGCHFPEVAETGAGEVVPVDGEAVGQALIRVLNDKTAQTAMGQAGRRLVEERFLWPVIAERMVQVYEEFNSNGS